MVNSNIFLLTTWRDSSAARAFLAPLPCCNIQAGQRTVRFHGGRFFGSRQLRNCGRGSRTQRTSRLRWTSQGRSSVSANFWPLRLCASCRPYTFIQLRNWQCVMSLNSKVSCVGMEVHSSPALGPRDGFPCLFCRKVVSCPLKAIAMECHV